MKLRFITAFVLAVTAVGAPAFSLEAMRCNVQTKPGLFQPVLRIVDKGMIEDIRMGKEGLSRTIFYRDREVLKYVSTKFDVPMTAMPSTVSGQCGSTKSGTAFQGGNGGGGAIAAVTAPTTLTSPSLETSPEIDTPSVEPSDVYDGESVF